MTVSRRAFVRSSGVALASLGLPSWPRSTVFDRRHVVCLFQRGAVDGLSMVVPHAEPLYYRERPRIAIPAREVVDLDGQFGLHPSLAALKPHWNSKSLAAFVAVGAPDPVRRHMDAQERLDGWLRRGGAVTLGSLRDIAWRIKTGTAPPIAVTSMGGWDTHFNQGSSDGQLATRFRELGYGLAAFSQDLGERMRNVVVLTISEFGRTIAENGNGGTDHGHATAMLALGGLVNGGKVLGTWPGLEGRDVPVTTDFRDVFGEFTHSLQRFPGAIRG